LAVVGGLVVSQLLTLYITPVIYLYMEKLQGHMGKPKSTGRPVGQVSDLPVLHS
jgi:HAE1 family hydrophobic/amphiphilic exporter-1